MSLQIHADARDTRVGPSKRIPGRRPAFTLVELLVVIGIIAVLIGILLPTLGRARSQARTVACQSQMREIGAAFHMYANANKGSLPPGYYFVSPDPAPLGTHTRWVDLLQGLLAPKYGGNSSDAYASNAARATVRKIFICPEVISDIAPDAFCTYLTHPRLIPQLGNEATQGPALKWITWEPYYLNRSNDTLKIVKRPYQLGRIKRASEIALMWEAPMEPVNGVFDLRDGLPVANQIDKTSYYNLGSPNLTDDYTIGGLKPGDPVELTQGFQGRDTNKDLGVNYQQIRFRHNKDTVANALMADGHVESFRYNGQTKTSTLLRRNIYVNIQQ